MTTWSRSGAALHPNPDAYDIARWGGAVSRTPRTAAATWAPDRDGVHQIALTEHQPLDILVQGLDRLDRPGRERVILVCLSGAVAGRNGAKAPFFSGVRLAQMLDVPLIAPSDPSLALDPTLALGWYAGHEGAIDLPRLLATVIDSAARSLVARLVVAGGSGGGFAALLLARLLDTRADILVWNPQTTIENYAAKFVDHYLRAAFPSQHSNDSVKPASSYEILRTALSASGASHTVCQSTPFRGNISIIYMQNIGDWHVNKHTIPFMKSLNFQKTDEGVFKESNSYAYVYFGLWGEGHAPPPHAMLATIFRWMLGGAAPGTVAQWLARGRENVAPVLPDFDPFAPRTPLRVSVTARREAGQVHARAAVLPAQPAGATYAFYLIRDGQREAMRWYRPEPEAVFDIPAAPGRLSVRAFARDREGATTIVTAPVADDAR